MLDDRLSPRPVGNEAFSPLCVCCRNRGCEQAIAGGFRLGIMGIFRNLASLFLFEKQASVPSPVPSEPDLRDEGDDYVLGERYRDELVRDARKGEPSSSWSSRRW